MSELSSPLSSDELTDRPSTRVARLGLSLLFWIALVLSAMLVGLLVLSPRLVERGSLLRRYHHNQAQLQRLVDETTHWSRIADGLRRDESFLARVTLTELHATPRGQIRVPLDPSLGYDSRALPEASAAPALPMPRWLPWMEQLAGPTPLRMRCTFAAVSLLLLAFGCLHEGFRCRALWEPLQGLGRAMARRYRRGGPEAE